MAEDMTAYERLAGFVRRVESLNEDKAGIQADISEVFGEAKGEGFDTKAIRRIIAKRRKDPRVLREQEEIDLLYESALERAGTNRPAGMGKVDPIKEGS